MSLVGRKPRILRARRNKRGYLRVSLHAHSDYLIHRLVAQAFIPNPDNLPFINHKDECPFNNCVDNLEWCTHKYNINYGTCQERARATQQITHPQQCQAATSKKVKCIETGIVYGSIKDAARKTGLWYSAISSVCLGKRNMTGGYHWKFIDEGETH